MPEMEQLTADVRVIEAAREPLSLLEQVDMEVAELLEVPPWWGDDPFAGIPNARDEENQPF